MPHADIAAEEAAANRAPHNQVPELNPEAVAELMSIGTELEYLGRCVDALECLSEDPRALSRAMRYLSDRYGNEAQ